METIGHNLFGCNLDIVIFWPASAVDGTGDGSGGEELSSIDDALPAAVSEEDLIGVMKEGPELTLQFVETTYHLKDVAFLTLDLGWAVGAPTGIGRRSGPEAPLSRRRTGG